MVIISERWEEEEEVSSDNFLHGNFRLISPREANHDGVAPPILTESIKPCLIQFPCVVSSLHSLCDNHGIAAFFFFGGGNVYDYYGMTAIFEASADDFSVAALFVASADDFSVAALFVAFADDFDVAGSFRSLCC